MIDEVIHSATGAQVMHRGRDGQVRRYTTDEWAQQHPQPIAGMPPGEGGFVLPHAITFQGLVSSLARTYRNPDQAFQDSLENARSMRNDLSIMECLEQRQRSTAMLNWHLEIEGEKSEDYKEFLDEMTRIVASTGCSPQDDLRAKPFTEYNRSLLESIWYGKQGMQHAMGWRMIGGKPRIIVADWQPINGDKLCFRYDDGSHQYQPGQPGIRVRTSWGQTEGERQKVRLFNSFSSEWREIDVEQIGGTQWTDRGLAYFLDKELQKQVLIHRYLIEDAAYETPINAGSLDGIGVRSRIYWTWFQKQETLGYLMEYLERSALGIEIWEYPAGNNTALQQVQQAAEQRFADGRNIVFVPRYLDQQGNTSQYNRQDPSAAGAEVIKSILVDFFGHQIKRYILGQTLTSEADSTGLGSRVADLHLDTYLQIIRCDAAAKDETLTNQLVRRLQKWNYLGKYRDLPLRFVTDTQSDDIESKLAAWRQFYDMGGRIKAKDVYQLIGASPPSGDDEVLESQEAAQRRQQIEMQKLQQEQQRRQQFLSPGVPWQPDAGRLTAERFIKDDSGHDRAPAGSAEGGQFVSQGGENGGSSGGESQPKPKEHDPKITSMVAEHNAANLSTEERKKAVEAAGVKWKDYKNVRYAPGTEAQRRSVEAGIEAVETSRGEALAKAKAEETEWKANLKKKQEEVAETERKAAEEKRARSIAEIEANRDITPHWPTYRTITGGVAAYNEFRNAKRHGDVGDVLAFKGPAEHFEDAIREHIHEAGELARDVWQTVERTGRMSEKQAKLLAVACAKVASKKQDQSQADEERMKFELRNQGLMSSERFVRRIMQRYQSN